MKTEQGPSTALIILFAIATGALVANLYYAQPLIASIGPELHISADLAGSVVSISQIGYGIGLFFLVSLADLVENRRLVLGTLTLTIVGSVAAATATSAPVFFAASLLTGLCSTGAQVLLPFIAHLAPEARRGRVVGSVMAGVLTGIMLARRASLFIAAAFGWRAVFWASAGLMLAIGVMLARVMPRDKPRGGMHYGQILASMLALFLSAPALRRRAAYQALMFAAFSMFWTAAPLMLADHFGLSRYSIAIFALAAAGGALAAPFVGRLADRGLTRLLTAGAMITLGVTFYATDWAVAASSMAALVILTVLLDAAVQTNQITGQRIIYAVPVETRGRMNALYMTLLFAGGAIGSVLGTITYDGGGWTATAAAGGVMGLLMLLLFGAELRGWI
ncbi:MFS transporter [Hypericibacter adhaerens]|uniref:MFS transporter n=2 Tax=Hypericibacter adhaerens TaxID=2602016 RepID=A0A5J6MS63_9PROT|nr:MFS transporter [Hypericibacter adhaerens]QEX20173.1 MFS transporter [Hypericibacter adhaerens]